MVRGLELFKEHFKGHDDSYVLFGGTACDMAMDAAGEDFRVTKDLDIVLCVEELTPDFVRTFWEFVKAGRYDNQVATLWMAIVADMGASLLVIFNALRLLHVEKKNEGGE